jgi:hypothetical protein
MERPNNAEMLFLSYSYDFFLDIHEEASTEEFWQQNSYYRFSRFRDALLVYSEILEYKPIGWFIEAIKKLRPPMEAELSKEFLLFVRNLLTHFPFFKAWNEVRFTKQLINWSKPGRTIDKFLTRFAGHEQVKYRVWNTKKKEMLYLPITFPQAYTDETEIKLSDFVPEREGIMFSLSLMYRVLMSQVESINNTATDSGHSSPT